MVTSPHTYDDSVRSRGDTLVVDAVVNEFRRWLTGPQGAEQRGSKCGRLVKVAAHQQLADQWNRS